MIKQHNKYPDWSIFVVFLLLAVLYRFLLAYSVFGGGDATGIQSFILGEKANISVYEHESPWPYLPMTVGLLHLAGYLSEIFSSDAQHHYRMLISLVDLTLAFLIYSHSIKNSENKLPNLIAFSIYAFNPVASMITSILGFLDATTLLVMFFIATRLNIDFHQRQPIDIKINTFLIAIATSFKPMGIILLPYLMYRSRQPFLVLLYFTIFIHVCNFNFILEMGFLDFYNLIGYIFVKMTVGHQLSGIGLGAFENFISFTNLKLITIMGLLFSAFLILQALRTDPFTYIAIAFLSLLAFRYNTHPQYLLWPIPFLIVARGLTITSLYTFISAVAIIMALPSWHSNSGAYILIQGFGFDTSGNIDKFLKSGYDGSPFQYSLQILLIFSIIVSIRLKVIKTSFFQVCMYFLNLIKSIRISVLIGYSSIYLPLILLNSSYIFIDDLLFSMRFIVLCIAPVLLLIILFSIRLPTPSMKLYQGLFLTFAVQQFLISQKIFDVDILRWTGALFYIVLLVELRRITDYLLPIEKETNCLNK